MFFEPLQIIEKDMTLQEWFSDNSSIIGATLGFSGPLTGSFYFLIPVSAADEIDSNFLGIETEEIDDEQRMDTVKEALNMIGGGSFSLFDKDGETLGRVGKEFGATTGRPRRCGWLDLVALKYAVQINGVTELMMMKADVLSGFKKVKVCTAYNYKGDKITHLPYNIEAENVTPMYTEMEGWEEDLTKMSKPDELPDTLNEYILFLEKVLEVPIKIVSVGPDRIQTIHR
jgi:adenylosuccinate synthase